MIDLGRCQSGEHCRERASRQVDMVFGLVPMCGQHADAFEARMRAASERTRALWQRRSAAAHRGWETRRARLRWIAVAG